MKNISLKWVIIGSLVLLVIAAAGVATYVWTNGELKAKNTTTTTTKATTKKLKTNTSKVESTNTVTVPATAVDASGDVDLSKLR